MPNNIVIGQKVTSQKIAQAKALRRNMTPAERILWQNLRGNRLAGFHFRRQQIIEGYIVDFYCHQAALVVEVDGTIHDQQQEYDAYREQVLRARGMSVVRFKNDEVFSDLDGVLARIVTACRENINETSLNPPYEGGRQEKRSPRRESGLPLPS